MYVCTYILTVSWVPIWHTVVYRLLSLVTLTKLTSRWSLAVYKYMYVCMYVCMYTCSARTYVLTTCVGVGSTVSASLLLRMYLAWSQPSSLFFTLLSHSLPTTRTRMMWRSATSSPAGKFLSSVVNSRPHFVSQRARGVFPPYVPCHTRHDAFELQVKTREALR